MTSTREALVDAAAALLDEGGVAAVTLREVGRRVGVSHNAPYKHFADKEDPLAAVAARDLRRVRESSQYTSKNRSGLSVVTAMLHGYVRDALAHPELFRLTDGPWRVGSRLPLRIGRRAWPGSSICRRTESSAGHAVYLPVSIPNGRISRSGEAAFAQ